MAKKKTTTDQSEEIIGKFFDHVLHHERFPKTVYKFCKELKISESEFYKHFGSIESIKEEIWLMMLKNAIELTEKEESDKEFSGRDKILVFYFSLFEIFKANRSYILLTIKQPKLCLVKELLKFKGELTGFIHSMVELPSNQIIQNTTVFVDKGIKEVAWLQFLMFLKFWKNDNSSSFEKTDVLIEKSVNTSFDLVNSKSLSSIFDLGKFMFKEKSFML